MTRLSMKGTPLGDKYQRLSKDDLAITLRAHQAMNDAAAPIKKSQDVRKYTRR